MCFSGQLKPHRYSVVDLLPRQYPRKFLSSPTSHRQAPPFQHPLGNAKRPTTGSSNKYDKRQLVFRLPFHRIPKSYPHRQFPNPTNWKPLPKNLILGQNYWIQPNWNFPQNWTTPRNCSKGLPMNSIPRRSCSILRSWNFPQS